MKKILKQASSTIILIMAFNSVAHAQSFRMTKQKKVLSLKGSEFISGDSYKKSMISVKIIGEVNKAGVHIVPENSSFSTLLSYAGGPTKDADITKIAIKRNTRSGHKNIKLDFKDYMQNNQKDLTLKPNDLIYVDKEKEFMSTRTFTVVATVLSIIVSGIVIKKEL